MSNIKKFEQFTKSVRLNESIDINRSFIDDYFDLCKDCLMANIEIVKRNGGKIELKKPDTIIGYYHDNLRRKSIVMYLVKQSEERDRPVADCYKNEDGEYLVAVTNMGEEIEICTENCTEFSYFEINDTLVSYYV